MSEFIALRTHVDEMPPRSALSERQKDVLAAWHDTALPGIGAAAGQPRQNNRLPQVRAMQVDEGAGVVSLQITATDEDRDILVGALYAERGGERLKLSGELSGGLSVVRWDTTGAAEGSYDIVAQIDDGLDEVEQSLLRLEVDREGGNTAPTLRFARSFRDVLVHSADSVEAVVDIADPDAGDSLSLVVEAVLGGEVVEVLRLADVQRGVDIVIPLDFSGLRAHRRWRLRARVSDGASERSVETGPFILASGETELRFSDVQPILEFACAPCHPGSGQTARVPGVPISLLNYDDIFALRGPIYRRAIDERTMPPRSAQHLFGSELSAEERDELGEWLLGGSPQ
jgi:hypothetical protein